MIFHHLIHVRYKPWIVQTTQCMTPASMVAQQPVRRLGQVSHVTLPARRPVDVQIVWLLMEATV